MTLADDFRALELELAGTFGQSATLTTRTSTTYTPDGEVVEVTAEVTVVADGPVADVDRYAASGFDSRVTATWYLPASGLTVTPKKGDRLTAAEKVWQVYQVETYQVQGITTSYRLDCGEVAE